MTACAFLHLSKNLFQPTSHANPPKRRMSRPGSTDIHNEIRRSRPETARDRQPPGGRPRSRSERFLCSGSSNGPLKPGNGTVTGRPRTGRLPAESPGRARSPSRQGTAARGTPTVTAQASLSPGPSCRGPPQRDCRLTWDRSPIGQGEAAPRVPRSPASEQPVLGGRVKRLRRLFYTLRRAIARKKGRGSRIF